MVAWNNEEVCAFCFIDFARTSADIVEKHLDEWLPGIMRRYVHFVSSTLLERLQTL